MPANASPLITVITPAYNVGPYIAEAVGSVLAQTFGDFEHLVVDDGSTDDTIPQIEACAAADDRVRLIRSDHGGATVARNIGLERARGEYIAFLDGDDRWSPDFLEDQLALLRSLDDDVAAVFCRARVMSESGRVYLLRWQRAGRYDFDDMLIDSCPPRVGSSLLIRKSAFDRAGLFDPELRSAQDLDMWLRIQRDSGMPYFWGNRAYLLDIRVRAGAISRDHGRRFAALDEIAATYAPDLARSPRAMAYVRPAVFAYRAGDEAYAERWAAEAKQAGAARLLRDGFGRRLILWSAATPKQRAAVGSVNARVRSLIGSAIGVAGGLKR